MQKEDMQEVRASEDDVFDRTISGKPKKKATEHACDVDPPFDIIIIVWTASNSAVSSTILVCWKLSSSVFMSDTSFRFVTSAFNMASYETRNSHINSNKEYKSLRSDNFNDVTCDGLAAPKPFRTKLAL